jgi:hypothetical protein
LVSDEDDAEDADAENEDDADKGNHDNDHDHRSNDDNEDQDHHEDPDDIRGAAPRLQGSQATRSLSREPLYERRARNDDPELASRGVERD